MSLSFSVRVANDGQTSAPGPSESSWAECELRQGVRDPSDQKRRFRTRSCEISPALASAVRPLRIEKLRISTSAKWLKNVQLNRSHQFGSTSDCGVRPELVRRLENDGYPIANSGDYGSYTNKNCKIPLPFQGRTLLLYEQPQGGARKASLPWAGFRCPVGPSGQNLLARAP
jgi:hypothetical protein